MLMVFIEKMKIEFLPYVKDTAKVIIFIELNAN